MNNKQLITKFKEITTKMVDIAEKKNADYSKVDDALKNFKLVEELGIATTSQGFLTRMTDKLARISNLINQEAQVEDEKIEDTLLDLANYSILMMIYLEDRNNADDNVGVMWSQRRRDLEEIVKVLKTDTHINSYKISDLVDRVSRHLSVEIGLDGIDVYAKNNKFLHSVKGYKDLTQFEFLNLLSKFLIDETN